MKNKKKKINIKVVAIAAIVFIVVIVTIFKMIISNESKMVINETDLYQYTGETKLEYKGNVVINKDEDNKTTLEVKNDGDETVTLDSTPVYYKDEAKVIFPKTMALVFQKEGTQFKVNHFTIISLNEFKEATLKDRTTEKMINNCFLYDGNDLYFLIGNYKTVIAGKDYSLSTFSYLRVDNLNGIVEVYDYSNDKMEIIETNDEVILVSDTEQINTTLDLIKYQGKSSLLIKKVDKLKNFS